MTWLLDGNVLVAMRIDTHVSHDRAHRWFGTLKRDRFATCVLTQGTLLRVHMKTAADPSAAAAWRALSDVSTHPGTSGGAMRCRFSTCPIVTFRAARR